jgi:hypothetical protein
MIEYINVYSLYLYVYYLVILSCAVFNRSWRSWLSSRRGHSLPRRAKNSSFILQSKTCLDITAWVEVGFGQLAIDLLLILQLLALVDLGHFRQEHLITLTVRRNHLVYPLLLDIRLFLD